MRARGGRAALGLRDVLDEPATVRAEWDRASLGAQVVRYFDRVLVYGSGAVLDPVEEYALGPRIAELTEYCGYVLNDGDRLCRAGDRAALPARRKRPVILATVGGGEDGRPLLETFIEAARGAALGRDRGRGSAGNRPRRPRAAPPCAERRGRLLRRGAGD